MATKLYISHQEIAPLVTTLEDIVDQTTELQKGNCITPIFIDEKYEIRIPIYEYFLNIVFALALEQNGIQTDKLQTEADVLPNQIDAFLIEGDDQTHLATENQVQQSKR